MAASKSEPQQASDAPVEAAADSGGGEDVGAAEQGNAAVQSYVDTLNEQGYSGTAGDPTPNDNYTVAGVTSGAPTPETDPEAAEAARVHQAKLAEGNSK